MLERTSACLDNGVRLSLRAQRLLPKTRRLLHSTFWTPQAPDFDPPQSLHASATVAAPSASPCPSWPSPYPPSESSDVPFLDFLYPLPTQAFIARLSHPEKWSRRNTRPPALRGYSSLTTPQDNPSKINRELEELRHLLSLDNTTSLSTFDVERAWHLCSNSRLDVALRKQAIAWFSGISGDTTARHVLDLFAGLSSRRRSAYDYRAAISASCHLDRHPEAVAFHAEASKLRLSGSIGSELLLAREIHNNDWQSALDVLRVFEKYTANHTTSLNPWANVDFELDFLPKFRLLLSYILEAEGHDQSHGLHHLYGSLLQGYAVFLSNQGLFLNLRDSPQSLRTFRYLVRRMLTAGIGSTDSFEKVLATLLNVPRGASHFKFSALVNFTYSLYKRLDDFTPSTDLLTKMLKYWREHTLAFAGTSNGSFVHLQELIDQWQKFHGRIGDDALVTIMETFARLGDVESVESYASLLKSSHPDGLPDSSKLWPLIYVHAVLAKPADALDRTSRFLQDFGVRADARCLNIVLHAYDRAGDLAGAAAFFAKMIDAGQHPDAYAYGSLMNSYAKLGDFDSVLDLLEQINSSGTIKPTMHMMNSMILALVNSDDMEGAKKALDRAIQASRAGHAEGSLALCFNTMFVANALRRDLNGSMDIYRRMREEKVELDERSYGALLQVLCVFRQTRSAHKIVRNVMPLNQIRPMAFHYTILMSGYINQGMFEKALEVAEEMDAAGIRATAASRAVALKAKAYHEAMEKRGQVDESGNPVPLEEVINDYKRLLVDPKISPAVSQPEPGRRHESPGSRVVDAGFLIYIHGERQSFAAVERLLQMQGNKLAESNESSPILRLLTTLMSVHCRAGAYSEVDRYWELIKKHADQLRLSHVSPADPEKQGKNSDVTTTSSAKKMARIMPSHRFILSRPLLYYTISQFAQSTPNKVVETMFELISSGYQFDNRTWNNYIVHLCEAGPPRALLAFTMVERFMIANWPGWITARRGIITNKVVRPSRSARRERLEYIKTRYLRPGQLIPQYQTMVRLAEALLEVRNFEARGMSYEMPKNRREYRELMRQVGSILEIREKAPKTLHAVQSMPRVLDSLQVNLFSRAR